MLTQRQLERWIYFSNSFPGSTGNVGRAWNGQSLIS